MSQAPMNVVLVIIEFTSCKGRRSLSGLFFVSSRRRHTRCLSDWSSDVCSSDPKSSRSSTTVPRRSAHRHRRSSPPVRQPGANRSSPCCPVPGVASRSTGSASRQENRREERSEERRVGKECRQKGAEEQYMNKDH